MNIKGFTLIEASIVVGLSMFASIGAIKYTNENIESSKINSLSSKIVNAIGAIDQRIYIDKYDKDKWPAVTDYITNNQVKEFLGRELISSKANCGDTANGWNPTIIDSTDPKEVSYKEDLKLVSCKPWGDSDRLEFDLEASLYVIKDTETLKEVNIYFKFKETKDFKDDLLSLRKVLKKSKEIDTPNITGSHSYTFVDMSASDPSVVALSMKDCINKKENCGLLAQYSSDGNGLEHLDVTGGNSMIGSKVSFVESNGSAVISDCKSFEKDIINGWIPKDNLVCGIGIDQTKGTNYIDADVYSTSSKRVFLNKLCKLSIDPALAPIEVPCGISTEYGTTEAYAVLDEVHSSNAYISLLEVQNIKTKSLSVQNDLSVALNTSLNDLNVDGLSVFNELVELKAPGNIAQNLYVAGDTELDMLKVKSGATFEKSVEIKGSLSVDGYIKADHLKLGTIASSDINKTCTEEGAMKVYRNGYHTEPVICTTFKDIDDNEKTAWKLSNARIGQVMPFDGSCPEAFEYFTEARGRFLIGENEKYLDSLSAAEQTQAIIDGKVFLDPNGNVLRYKLGDTGGEAVHKLTIAEMPSHDHKVPTIKASCSGSDCAGYAMVQMNHSNTVWSREAEIPTGVAGEGKAHENTPPYYTVNYCMYTGK